MPLYVGDYLGATQHLSTFESGAYLHVLMCMWLAGGKLPNDPQKLARCAKLTRDKWSKIAPVVMEFFAVEGDFITQGRLAKEIGRYEKTVLLRREAGRAGYAAKYLKRNKPAQANGNDLHKPGLSNQNQTPTEIEPKSSISDRSAQETLARLIEAAPLALKEIGLDDETMAFVVSNYSPEGQAAFAAQFTSETA